MDFIIFTTFENKPLSIIVENFKYNEQEDNYYYVLVSVIKFNTEKNIQEEVDVDDFEDEDFLDNKVDEAIKLHRERGWVSLVEIIN